MGVNDAARHLRLLATNRKDAAKIKLLSGAYPRARQPRTIICPGPASPSLPQPQTAVMEVHGHCSPYAPQRYWLLARFTRSAV